MSNPNTKLFCVLSVLSLVISSTLPAFAQETTSGAAAGKVYDIATTQGIAGARVQVTNIETGSQRYFSTRADGSYTATALISGIYSITASSPDYENIPDPNTRLSTISAFRVDLAKTRQAEFPPIALQKRGASAVASPPQIPEVTPELLVDTTSASRGGNFGEGELMTLPLPGVRSFDDLAFLLPGVAPPPLAIGRSVGPGIGPGVGTSGQFAVNGIRSRSNNFTIDGSDNNDQDIGVRRQGFTSLIPQSIESTAGLRVTTLLAEPQYARNMGAQVNAVSRYGGDNFHGTVYGFLTGKQLRARDRFDFIGGPSGGEDTFTRTMFGLALGGPIVKQRTHFFVSYEHQDLNARREAQFAVPTPEQRGLFDSGLTGLTTVTGTPVFPASPTGNAFFSFFPFPNNPSGPYGPNNFSEVLPAGSDGNIFSLRLDHNLKAFGRDHTLSGRYNFLGDNTILPVTGEALFSSLRALVRAQNFAMYLNSQLSVRSTNIFRFSYGRTHLNFEEVRDPFLVPAGTTLTNPKERRFLLNARIVANQSLPSGPNACTGCFVTTGQDTESVLGPIGQVNISNYSPVGVDVFNFPQNRTNQTFQYADTFFYEAGKNRLALGIDARRIHLDSLLDRNTRPLAVFRGAADLFGSPIVSKNMSQLGGLLYFGRDFAAVGAPTGFFQTLTTGPDSSINLRYWETAYFLSDKIRLSSNFTLTAGLRYERNTVPTDKDRKIENTFNSPDVQAIPALTAFLAGRSKIFEKDNNNVAPYLAFAWDPTGSGRMAIRGGYGIYYDQIPGAVISQSRNVFPTFLPVDLAGAISLNPTTVSGNRVLGFIRPGAVGLVQTGTLNRVVLPAGLTPATFLNSLSAATSGGGGPAFVLPDADLVTPYAEHWSLTVERQFARDFLVSVAYVGTRGTHLLRFDTPNLGLNSIPVVRGAVGSTPNSLCGGGTNTASIPCFFGTYQPPSPNGGTTFGRPQPQLGAFTSIKSDSNSTYHSLQVQGNKRFSHGIEFTTSYTWSHAIDEVSDLFDLAGTLALPQDSFDRRRERGDANFDVRHRFVYSFVWNLPGFQNSHLLGGWQIASIGTFQTGQPYSVISCCDNNLNGNLTDRVVFDPSATPLPLSLTGRNQFRAPGIYNVDLSLNKFFTITESKKIEFRTEFYNLFNRTQYGIPAHQLAFANAFPGPGPNPLDQSARQQFTYTVLPPFTVQFALKFRF
jgi:hypothetical protein